MHIDTQRPLQLCFLQFAAHVRCFAWRLDVATLITATKICVSADVQLVHCAVLDAESQQRRGSAGSGRLTAVPDLTSRSSVYLDCALRSLLFRTVIIQQQSPRKKTKELVPVASLYSKDLYLALAVASNLIAIPPAVHGLKRTSDASNYGCKLLAMASNLLAMASNL